MTCLPCENCHGKKTHIWNLGGQKLLVERGFKCVYIYIYIYYIYIYIYVIHILLLPSFHYQTQVFGLRALRKWGVKMGEVNKYSHHIPRLSCEKKKNVVFLQSHVFVALIRSTYALISIVDLSLTGETTSRIIPVSKWLIPMVIVSLLVWVVGPLPNGRFMAYKRGLLTTSWDDPPSRWTSSRVFRRHHWVLGRNLLLPKIRRFKTPRLEEVGENRIDIHPPKY